MLDKVKDIINLFESTDLKSMELELSDLNIKIKLEQKDKAVVLDQSSSCFVPTKEDKIQKNTINSPLVGVFYSRPEPNAEPFITVGEQVKNGDTLFIVEAMKVMNEIKAPRDLVVKEILIKDGDTVDFDMPILVVGD